MFVFQAELLEATVVLAEVEDVEDVEDDPAAEEAGEDTDRVVLTDTEEEELGVAVTRLVNVLVIEASVADSVVVVLPATELTDTVVVTCVDADDADDAELVDVDEELVLLDDDDEPAVVSVVDEEVDVPSIVKVGLMFPESPNKAMI